MKRKEIQYVFADKDAKIDASLMAQLQLFLSQQVDQRAIFPL